MQTGAGVGSAITDDDFVAAGGRIVPDADAVFNAAGLIVKVKEPQPEEYERSAPTMSCSPTCIWRPMPG